MRLAANCLLLALSRPIFAQCLPGGAQRIDENSGGFAADLDQGDPRPRGERRPDPESGFRRGPGRRRDLSREPELMRLRVGTRLFAGES